MATTASARPSFDPPVQPLLRRATKEQVARLIEVATATSGQFVSRTGTEPGDDSSLTFRFPYPLPPRFNRFLEEAAAISGMLRLFPYGILSPDGILVQVNFGKITR